MPQFEPYLYKNLIVFVLIMTGVLFLVMKYTLIKTSAQVTKLREKFKGYVSNFENIKKRNPSLHNFYQTAIKFFKKR